MIEIGQFTGIGVGPGDPGLVTVAGVEALKAADVVFAPRAGVMEYSVARRIVETYGVTGERFREVEFAMEKDRASLDQRYAELARMMVAELRVGKRVVYLTLGDAMTYSTYVYAVDALREELPGLEIRTIPGVTSFAAVAAATNWALGEKKERMLVLPCPDSEDELKEAIDDHDVVALMKVGKRWGMVMGLLQRLEVVEHCVFGHRVGMPEEVTGAISGHMEEESLGYLTTILIRKGTR